jgi:hypothetical protein
VRALKFKRGDDALAIIKSTEVMIARMNASSGLANRRPTARKRSAVRAK